MLQWRFANWWSMTRTTTTTRQVHRQLLQGLMVLDPELFEMVLEFQDKLTLARHLLTVVLVVHRMPESDDELQLPKLNRHVGDIESATGLKVLRLVYNVTATTGQQHHQHNEFHDIVILPICQLSRYDYLFTRYKPWNSEGTSIFSHLEQLIQNHLWCLHNACNTSVLASHNASLPWPFSMLDNLYHWWKLKKWVH